MMMEAVRSAEACMHQGGSDAWGGPMQSNGAGDPYAAPEDSDFPAAKRQRGPAGKSRSNAWADDVLRAAGASVMDAHLLAKSSLTAAAQQQGQNSTSEAGAGIASGQMPPHAAAAYGTYVSPMQVQMMMPAANAQTAAGGMAGGVPGQGMAHHLASAAQWTRVPGMGYPMQPAGAQPGFTMPQLVAMGRFGPYIAVMQGYQPYADPQQTVGVATGQSQPTAPTPQSGTFAFPASDQAR